MSDFTYDQPLPIDGLGPGFFRIGGQVVSGPVLVLSDRVVSWGGYAAHGDIVALAPDIDVLLVGTGPEISHVPADFRAALEAANIGLDMMDTASACRTYNILLAEGRRVACALLPL